MTIQSDLRRLVSVLVSCVTLTALGTFPASASVKPTAAAPPPPNVQDTQSGGGTSYYAKISGPNLQQLKLEGKAFGFAGTVGTTVYVQYEVRHNGAKIASWSGEKNCYFSVYGTECNAPTYYDNNCTAGESWQYLVRARIVGASYNYGVWASAYYACSTPLAFDTNLDGVIGVTASEVWFDLDADGDADTLLYWLTPSGDALLVDTSLVSRSDGAALFGDEGGIYDNGFAKLSARDTNHDGVVSGIELEGLGLWFDDGNAMIELSEVTPIGQTRITNISLHHNKNLVSTAVLDDGTTMRVEDIILPTVSYSTSSSPAAPRSLPWATGTSAVAVLLVAGFVLFRLFRAKAYPHTYPHNGAAPLSGEEPTRDLVPVGASEG